MYEENDACCQMFTMRSPFRNRHRQLDWPSVFSEIAGKPAAGERRRRCGGESG